MPLGFGSNIVNFCYWPYVSSLQGRTLRCSLSETKYRLFIGNVPKSWTDNEFRTIIEATGPGAETIELIKVYLAFLFKDYKCHQAIWLDFTYCDLISSNYRIRRTLVAIVVLPLWNITTMLVLIILGKRCLLQALGWMVIHQL